MKRKNYEKPTTKVVQLKHQSHILAGSATGQQVGVQSYEYEDLGEE